MYVFEVNMAFCSGEIGPQKMHPEAQDPLHAALFAFSNCIIGICILNSVIINRKSVIIHYDVSHLPHLKL